MWRVVYWQLWPMEPWPYSRETRTASGTWGTTTCWTWGDPTTPSGAWSRSTARCGWAIVTGSILSTPRWCVSRLHLMPIPGLTPPLLIHHISLKYHHCQERESGSSDGLGRWRSLGVHPSWLHPETVSCSHPGTSSGCGYWTLCQQDAWWVLVILVKWLFQVWFYALMYRLSPKRSVKSGFIYFKGNYKHQAPFNPYFYLSLTERKSMFIHLSTLQYKRSSLCRTYHFK